MTEPSPGLLEELSLNAWPALQTILYGGWVVRLCAGYTRRANSVVPLDACRPPFDERVAACEAVYWRHGQPCIFKLRREDELDSFLAARGYTREAVTSVQVAALGGGYPVVEPEPFSEEWLRAFFDLNGLDPVNLAAANAQLRLHPLPAASMAIREEGRIVATGLAVLEREWAGLFDIAVAAHRRRAGLGRRITGNLLGWARRNGAARAYLQVVADNAPARSLYADLGFSEVYRYWYRRGPEVIDRGWPAL